MQFQSLREFLLMGGHGAYVWTAYGLTVLVMLALIWGPLARRRQALERIARREKHSANAGSGAD